MWKYTDEVMDHFLNPKNVGRVENPDGKATVGNMSCGDALELSFKLDDEGKIADAKFKTFGCGSAIASSSILTEMIIGLPLEEAEKITNKDIVDALGGLPDKKIHCSVMGHEALQAAIVNYRGEEFEEHDHSAYEGTVICHCFDVTDEKVRVLAKENNLTKVSEITDYCKAGGACGSCKGEIQEVLDALWERENVKEEAAKPENKMSFAQMVVKVQQVIDNDIRPHLEKDGGSIDFLDLKDDVVVVTLKGRCAMCPSAKMTLKNLVEKKLQELVSPSLIVEQE